MNKRNWISVLLDGTVPLEAVCGLIDDTVYMYVAAPVSAILYRCRVLETDIPYRYEDENLTITALMKVHLERRYPRDQFTFERLRNEFGVSAVRGPRGVPYGLEEALKEE